MNLVSSGAFLGVIAPKSFFLVGHKNFKGSPTADLIYSANSNNLAYTNNSAVLYNTEGAIIDEVSWSEIAKSQSFERKAWVSACVSASGNYEQLGNGCDTDNNAADFEVRSSSNPQNSQSQPEP